MKYSTTSMSRDDTTPARELLKPMNELLKDYAMQVLAVAVTSCVSVHPQTYASSAPPGVHGVPAPGPLKGSNDLSA